MQSLVDEGKLDPEDVSSHPQKSLILKAYTGRPVEPTLFMLDAEPGDRLLLCSDGLSDPVTASTIEQALKQGTVEEAATTLRDLALRSGGPDNVTIVVAEVVEAEGDEDSPITVGAIQGVVPEPTHPDSSASRAAKLISPPKAQAAEEKPQEEPQRRPQRSRIGWKVIACLAIVIVLVVSGGLWMKNYLGNNYYVATDEGGTLTIQQGADYEIFGRPLHHTYQNACLGKDNALKLGHGECAGDFAPFTLKDLPESERAAVGNLPSGSYDEVQTQLSQLSDKALKPCPKASKDGKDDKSASKGNCREVK